MKLPSKSTPYKNSVIALFPRILSLLREKDMSVSEIYEQIKDYSCGEYVAALDALYAFGKVDYNEERRMLHYVG